MKQKEKKKKPLRGEEEHKGELKRKVGRDRES